MHALSWKSISTPHVYLEFLADISPEEEARYKRRREEGYDIPDPRYEHWLGKKCIICMYCRCVLTLELAVDTNNLETRKGHYNDSNSSGDDEPFQTRGGEIIVHVRFS